MSVKVTLTAEQHRQLARRLGVPGGFRDGEHLMAELDRDHRERKLQADVAAQRRELESLRSRQRLAERERELDRRDEEEEAAYQRDFHYRFGHPAPSRQAR